MVMRATHRTEHGPRCERRSQEASATGKGGARGARGFFCVGIEWADMGDTLRPGRAARAR